MTSARAANCNCGRLNKKDRQAAIQRNAAEHGYRRYEPISKVISNPSGRRCTTGVPRIEYLSPETQLISIAQDIYDRQWRDAGSQDWHCKPKPLSPSRPFVVKHDDLGMATVYKYCQASNSPEPHLGQNKCFRRRGRNGTQRSLVVAPHLWSPGPGLCFDPIDKTRAAFPCVGIERPCDRLLWASKS